MKVFDFTDGKKGKFLGEAYRPSWMSGHLADGGKEKYVVRNRQYQFHTAAGTTYKGKDQPMNPADFGVEAICFCIGEWKSGTDSKWEWCALYTPEGLKAAIAAGHVLVERAHQERQRVRMPLPKGADPEAVKAALRVLNGDDVEMWVGNDEVEFVPAWNLTVEKFIED